MEATTSTLLTPLAEQLAVDGSVQYGGSPLKRPRALFSPPSQLYDDDEVLFVAEKTREERDAELLLDAVSLLEEEEEEEVSSTPSAPQIAKSEATQSPPAKKILPQHQEPPDVKPLIPSTQLPPPQPITLDGDQQYALSVALSGANLFLTGGAGVGKSHTLREIIDALKRKHGERHVAVTASTGCASVHVDGQTLHSLAGIGVPDHLADFARLWNAEGGMAKARWRELQVLIIDEISMADAEFLDCLSVSVDRLLNYAEIKAAEEAGIVRPSLPFGGRVQLIFVGDFCQLSPVKQLDATRRQGPPMPRLRDPPPPPGKNGGRAAPPYGALETHGHFAFQSVLWREAQFSVVELTRVHRQREPVLLDALNAIRSGNARHPAVVALIDRTKRPLLPPLPQAPPPPPAAAAAPPPGAAATPAAQPTEPVRLFCYNAQCDEHNAARLRELLSDAHVPRRWFRAVDSVEADEETVEETLSEEGGRRGQDEIVAELEAELWDAHFRERVPRPPQPPLGRGEDWRTAEACDEALELGVGAQVMLLANEAPGGFVNGDVGTVIEFRQPTVEEAAELDAAGQLQSGEASAEYAVVRFGRTNRNGASEKLVTPTNKVRKLYRVGRCVRRRLPLQLAWAFTVHKSQGMSIDRLQVELGNAFAAGQAYVALSRATSLEGLCVKSFDASRVKVNHDAQRFHAAVREATREATRQQAGSSDGGEGGKRAMVAYLEDSALWWKDVLEGPATHPAWADVFRWHGAHDGTKGTSFGTEFRRWEAAYPIPARYRKL